MSLFICYLTFCVPVHLNSPQKHQQILLDILWPCFNNQQRSQHYFTWHFVYIFTWTAHRKTNIIFLTFCGGVHLNSQQRNWHILLDILWSCYLNHLQINQHISPDILCLYSLELLTEKQHVLLNILWSYHLNKLQRSQHILLDILFIMFT